MSSSASNCAFCRLTRGVGTAHSAARFASGNASGESSAVTAPEAMARAGYLKNEKCENDTVHVGYCNHAGLFQYLQISLVRSTSKNIFRHPGDAFWGAVNFLAAESRRARAIVALLAYAFFFPKHLTPSIECSLVVAARSCSRLSDPPQAVALCAPLPRSSPRARLLPLPPPPPQRAPI